MTAGHKIMKNILARCFAQLILMTIVLPSFNLKAADSSFVQGKISYISGDAIYTSLGRKTGIADSSIVFVLSKTDTIASLKVYAISSQSSVARIIQTKRQLKIDDMVGAWVILPDTVRTVSETIRQDSIPARRGDSLLTARVKSLPVESAVTIRGRMGLRYYTNVDNNFGQSFTQPGLVFNLRGKVANSPIKFETYGNVRNLIRGSHNPFAASSTSQTRIYKLNVEYDDETYRIALGRFAPMYAPSVGYIDGATFTGKFSGVSLGLTAGYEPDFLQNSVSTTMKKIALFGNYQSNDAMRANLTAAYALTMYSSHIDREVISSSFSAAITPEIFVTAQGDLDLRTKSKTNLIFSPRMSSLFSNVNYRISSSFTAGIGYNAYRPIYSFASVQTLPDSFIDNTLRSSLNITGQLFLSGGISLNNTYSPRSADQGFGKEYFNNSTFSMTNVLNSGISFRTTVNLNSTLFASTRGIGVNLQRSFGNLADVSLRYQTYRNEIKQYDDQITTQSYAVDLMSTIIGRLSAWTSLERLTGSGTNSYNIYSELSWSF
jgi:hypothetical protein